MERHTLYVVSVGEKLRAGTKSPHFAPYCSCGWVGGSDIDSPYRLPNTGIETWFTPTKLLWYLDHIAQIKETVEMQNYLSAWALTLDEFYDLFPQYKPQEVSNGS